MLYLCDIYCRQSGSTWAEREVATPITIIVNEPTGELINTNAPIDWLGFIRSFANDGYSAVLMKGNSTGNITSNVSITNYVPESSCTIVAEFPYSGGTYRGEWNVVRRGLDSICDITTVSWARVVEGNVSSATVNHIWTGTQQQYDNLSGYSADTLYFIDQE